MRLTHGDTGTRLYRIWKSMKCRCLNSSHPTFKYYGARGIAICPEWMNDYATLKKWAFGNGYEENLELDRIDVDKGYSPTNCRWITHHDQTLNRRDTLYAVIDGEKRLLRDVLGEYGIPLNKFTRWRSSGKEECELSRLIGRKVVIEGGKSHRKRGCALILSELDGPEPVHEP